MADSKGPIASAVILPVEVQTSPRTKRRQSSNSDGNAKRPRLSISDDAKPSDALQSSPKAIATEPASERRKSAVVEERKRGQRLFGGLLSTLSQSSAGGQQKRRQEIEKRQQEKAKLQKVEDEGRKAEKLAKLKTIRKSEQIKFDEESMRIKHRNMLSMAHFLCTKTQPKLYYKPWELLPGDEERIKAQIADTETIVAREVEEFRAQHAPKEVQKVQDNDDTSEETVGEPQIESLPVSGTPTIVNEVTTDEQVPSEEKDAVKQASLELHNGEVVVEAEEDTVIY